MRARIVCSLVFMIACSTDHASDLGTSPEPPPSGDSGGGGGGVSFGGAQDIGELRAILDRGEIPGPNTFDANGFFNEHFNAQPPATCGQVLCISSGLSVGRAWVNGGHQATLQISLTTPLDPSTFERLPMNLVVVIDRSGSMASDGRLTKVKAGLHTMIDNLGAEDRLAIVDFDDRVTVGASLGAELDRPALHAVIDELTPRGSTNIFGGLERGFQLLGDEPAEGRQNRVILLSDGLATAGTTSTPAIMEMARSHVMRGIGLTTIGVGDEFDVELMRGLAEQGAGNFYFLEDAAAATEVFTEELDYFMQPIALDIKLSATAGPGYRFNEVVGSRLWSAQRSSGSMQIPAVFVASRTTQSGEQGRRGGGSMIFIVLTPQAGNTGRVADLTLSFRVPGSAERISQSFALDYASDPEETPEQPYLSSPEIAERYAMYNMYLGLRAAVSAGNLDCSAAALETVRIRAAGWNASHEDPDLAADLVLVDQFLANLAAHGAVAERCRSNPPYLPHPVEPEPEPVRYRRHRSLLLCSTGSASGSAPILLAALAAVFVGSRRRRR